MSKSRLLLYIVALALAGGGALYQYQFADGKPAPAATEQVAAASVIILTSPPRETAEEAELLYKPIADYLSQVIGKRVVYKYPGTWGVYRTEMLNGSYDIVFDGPHFVDYRVQKLQHNLLAKMPEIHEFVIIAHKDEPLKSIADLAGKTFCSEPPPNLGALVALAQFENPSRQPVVVPTKGWGGIYEAVTARRCAAGVLPLANLKKFDKDGLARILFKNQGLPNQAFSAGPRVTLEDQAKISAAMTAPEASGPTEKLRTRFNVGESFVSATNAEYNGVSQYLRNEFGFEAVAKSN
jgi:ABC-type nitrate/sulfonate/bicarbonate transport system substrate-binding protein